MQALTIRNSTTPVGEAAGSDSTMAALVAANACGGQSAMVASSGAGARLRRRGAGAGRP